VAYNDAREKRRASIVVGEERAWEFFPKMGDVREANVLSTIEGVARASMDNAHERSECCPSSRLTKLNCVYPPEYGVIDPELFGVYFLYR